MLLAKARDAINRRDDAFMDSEYARILAHAVSQVPPTSRTEVYKLIEQVAAQRPPLSSAVAEIYTALGRQQLDTPDMFQQVVMRAKSAPRYQSHKGGTVVEAQPGVAVVVGYGPWLEALAVLGNHRTLPLDAIATLKARANGPTMEQIVVQALSKQPGFAKQTCWTSSCAKLFKAFGHDSTKRRLTVNLQAENLAKLPHLEFLAALKTLESERALEAEPEIRIALGMTRVAAQLARVRTVLIGSQLFE